MAQPRDYTRQYNFNDYQATSPSDPLRGSEVDGELNAIKLTLDDLNANIAKIQRDDGKLGNVSVHKDAFDQGALAIINSTFTPRGNWSAAVSYVVNDAVNFNGATYVATVAHTSSAAFATDTSASRWLLIANAALAGTSSSVDKFEGDGLTTAFTLSNTYASETSFFVFVNGELLNPVDDYTLSGTTLTLYTAPGLPTVAGNENLIVWGSNVVAQASQDAAEAAESNASGFADEAESWASKTNGIVESTDYSSKAWATGGTGVDAGSGSAKDWASKVSGTVGNTTEYSSKYWATQGNVPIVATNIGDVNTVAGISSDVTTVSGIDANVTTVAGISSDVTTVSGISSNVSTVAGISSDVTTAAGDSVDIQTVASKSVEIGRLGTADAVSDMNTLGTAAIVSDLDTLADISTDISTVSGISANVTTAAGISANVTTVAGIASDVTTVSGINAAVSTVSGIASDVSTVSSNNANVTTVAGNNANVSTVAGVSTDVTTVSGISGNVTTVAGVSGDVTTVAGISSDVSTVSTNNANVTTTAGSITSVNTVASSIADVNTAASNIGDVNTVAGEIGVSGVVTIVAAAITDVSTVSGDIAAVITAANDLNEAVSEIDTVSNSIANVDAVGINISNVNTVAGNNANVSTVAGNTTNINTVAGIDANVTTVAGISSDVTTVSGISSDVSSVASDATDIGTVATNISSVNTVSGSMSDVTTVATNINNVNDFFDVYRVGTSDPSTDNDTGDLFYNTSSGTLKVYTGSAWEQGVTAGSGFMPLTGGQLTGNLTFSGAETVDGRDLSVDGAKLDGIEAGATADQTKADIDALGVAASTAATLATARNIAVTGAVTGSTSFDGSGNVSISTTATADPTLTLSGDASGSATFTNLGNATLTVTVADDSHNHVISNVDGLQTALNAKYDASNPNGYTTYTANQSLNTSNSPSFAGVNINGNLNAVDNIYLAGVLYHEGDTDTRLTFGTNNMVLRTGGTDRVLIDASGVRLGDSGNGYFQPVSGNYGSVQIDGGAHGGWEGYSIGGHSVFMSQGSETGLYNDANNEWLVQCTHNGSTRLYYNGSSKLETTGAGASVNGDLTVTGGDISLSGTGRIQGVDTVSSGTDATNKTYVDNAVASAAPSYSATASGSIANGAPVVVNSNGTLSSVAIGLQTQFVADEGTTTFTNSGTQFTGQYTCTYVPNQGCFLATGRISGVSNYHGCVGVMNDSGEMSWGAQQDLGFATGGGYDSGAVVACYDATVGKVIIAYNANTDLRVVPIAVDGAAKTASAGSSSTVDSSASPAGMGMVYGSGFAGCAVAYKRSTNILRMVIVKGSAGATSVSAGSPLTVESQSNTWFGLEYHPTHNRVVAVYNAPYYPSVGLFSVSNYSVSKVTSSQLGSGNISYYNNYIEQHTISFDPTADKFFVAYNRDFANLRGRTFSVTTNSISIGGEGTIASGSPSAIRTVFNSVPGNVGIVYTQSSNSGKFATVTLNSNNTFTVNNSGLAFGSGKIVKQHDLAYDPVNNHTLLSFRDEAGGAIEPNYATFKTTQNGTNLKSGNFIGISNGSYSNGQTATAQLSGSVDDAQSGLTPGSAYYVQGSGGIGPSASSPSVLAGTAVSSTKLVIK